MAVNRRFSRRRPERQARWIVERGLALGSPRHGNHGDGLIHSLGTAAVYEQSLTLLCRWIQENRLGDLRGAGVLTCCRFLQSRQDDVLQGTLDRDRRAAEFLLHQTTGVRVRLPRYSSKLPGRKKGQLARRSRAYTPGQIDTICRRLSARTALAARVCYDAGLRAHELHTLAPAECRQPSRHREWSQKRFAGRRGKRYTVIGKGGLVREVMLSESIAAEIEKRRRHTAAAISDRGIRYTSYYDLTGGQSLSAAFTKASTAALGWSAGVHGLRHTYAQERMRELGALGFSREERLEIVSQELGHFRSSIAEVYLR